MTATTRSTRPAGNKRQRRAWTAEEVVTAIREWTKLMGEPPRAHEWSGPAMRARLGLQERYAATERHWPSIATVEKYYGTWTAALAAANVKRKPERREFCKRGHRLWGRNVDVNPATGNRRCRRCRRERAYRLRAQRKRAAALAAALARPEPDPSWPKSLRRRWEEANSG